METQIILKAGDSVAGVIALHDTCPLSKIRQISTAFYAMRMTKPPFLWARGKKPSLSEAKKIISLGHKALTILDEKAAKEDLSAMFRLLSGVLKHQSTADAKATATAYLLSLNGVSHWALKTATRDIMKRKAEGLSKTFMPSAPELYAYCDKLERDIRGCVEYVFKVLEKSETVSWDNFAI